MQHRTEDGFAEQLNHTLLEKALVMMITSQLPESLCGTAIKHTYFSQLRGNTRPKGPHEQAAIMFKLKVIKLTCRLVLGLTIERYSLLRHCLAILLLILRPYSHAYINLSHTEVVAHTPQVDHDFCAIQADFGESLEWRSDGPGYR